MSVKLPKKVEKRLEHIKLHYNDVYYNDKLKICNLIYNQKKDAEDIWLYLDRYAAYRLYYYEPLLIDEEILGEEKVDQIKLLYELAIETI